MAYTDKFKITKDQNNEFIFTIKQNGSTLPMTISTGTIVDTVSITPKTTFTPSVTTSTVIAGTAGVNGIAAIPAMPAVYEKYEITIYTTGIITGTTIKLYINSKEYSVVYDSAVHTSAYLLLQAFKSVILADNTENITVAIDTNKLYLQKLSTFTVNSSGQFTISQTSAYAEATAGTPAVLPIAATAGSTTSVTVGAYYTATNEFIEVPLTSYYTKYSSATKFSLHASDSFNAVKINNTIVTPIEGMYTFYLNDSVSIQPALVDVEAKFDTVLQDITVSITVDIDVDTFSATLIKLSDNTVVFTKTLTVEDALSGKVKLIIPSEDTVGLVSQRGSSADRFYLKPVYKLLISCNTKLNGNFIAKIDNVYVD